MPNAYDARPGWDQSGVPGNTPTGPLLVTDPRNPAAQLNANTYGGYSGGAADWSSYYQGLGNAAKSALGQQGAGAVGNVDQYTQLAGRQAGMLNDAAAQSNMVAGQGIGALASAGAGQDRVSQMLAAQANGTGPSAAQAQLGSGISQAVRAQMAAAASTRGGAMAQAAAQQQAGINAAGIEGAGAGQAAQLRAQEQQAGMQGLAQYTQGAQVAGVNAANQQLSTNQGAANSVLGMAQTGALGQGQLGLGYTTTGLQAQQAYEGMASGIGSQQLQAAVAERGQNLGLQGTQEQIQANQTGQIIGGAGAALGAGLMLASDENAKTDVTPEGNASPGDGSTGGLTRDQLHATLAHFRSGWQQAFAPRPVQQAPLPMGPMSDERAKTDVAPAPTADALLDLLAKSKATYSYRDPADEPVSPMHPKVPGARFGGVMAQDLERAPEIGPQLVTNTPRGKMIEPAAGLSAVLMGLGRVHERLRALEASR